MSNYFDPAYKIDADSFFALMEVVERDGGAHLPQPCAATKIAALTKPGDPAFSHGCGQEVRFQVPYDNNDKEQFVVACANGDLMELWPRFERPLESA